MAIATAQPCRATKSVNTPALTLVREALVDKSAQTTVSDAAEAGTSNHFGCIGLIRLYSVESLAKKYTNEGVLLGKVRLSGALYKGVAVSSTEPAVSNQSV